MNDAMLLWCGAPLIGFIGMMSGGYWGVGCGWLVVPTMLILGFEPLEAVGIGLLQMAPSALLTVIRQAPEIGWKKGEPGRTLVLPLAAGALLTSFAGKPINRLLIEFFGDSRPLQYLLIGVILVIGIQTLLGKTAVNAAEMPPIDLRKQKIAFGAGLATGLLSSLLGVGGGILTRPLLSSFFRVPEYYTSRIVRLLLLLTTTLGGITYLTGDQFHWHILAVSMVTAAGGILGFPLGAKMHKIVFNAGFAQHIHKSFAIVALALLTSTSLNLAGCGEISRYIMLGIGAGLTLYLVLFSWYAARHRRAD